MEVVRMSSLTELLWREASLATELDAFLTRLGAAVLAELDVDVMVVRAIDADHQQLVTAGAVRRGTVGVAHPARPRVDLSATGLVRLSAWIEAGGIDHFLAHRAS